MVTRTRRRKRKRRRSSAERVGRTESGTAVMEKTRGSRRKIGLIRVEVRLQAVVVVVLNVRVWTHSYHLRTRVPLDYINGRNTARLNHRKTSYHDFMINHHPIHTFANATSSTPPPTPSYPPTPHPTPQSLSSARLPRNPKTAQSALHLQSALAPPLPVLDS
jgi:hypothetical protein